MATIEINSEKYEKVSFTKTISFSANGVEVRFEHLGHSVPGFSHKVMVIKDRMLIATDWLIESKNANSKEAEFFYNKHINKCYKW